MDKKWEKIINDYAKHCERVAKISVIAQGETPGDQSKRIKKLESKYTDWFEYYFPHYAKVKCAPYHKKIADAIINNKQVRLLVEVFRSGAKSVHVCMGIPLLLYVTDQLHFMMLVGETDPKAKRLLGDIQAELQFNPRFKHDYGQKFKAGDWADGNFITNDGVRFVSLGFGQSPRGLREGGERPDYIVIDDVENKRHVNNDRLMSESVDYIFEDIEGCFDAKDNGTERLIFSNNNIHKNGITNRIKKKYLLNIEKDKLNGVTTDHVIVSAAAVTDLVTFTPTWPEKTSAEYWRKKYNKNSRSFKREYMNMHVADGKMFKQEMMQWKDMLRYSQYDALVFYGDLSYKEQGDYKALVLVGKAGREKHILHSFLRQVSRRESARWLYDLYEDKKFHNYNIFYKIEGLFAQDEFINDFDEEGDERGYYIAVTADKRPKEGKHDRIESILGFFERRNVWWNIKEKDYPDQVDAIEQFTAFEKGSKAHDDFPDATHGAFHEIEMLFMPDRSDPKITSRSSLTEHSKHRS